MTRRELLKQALAASAVLPATAHAQTPGPTKESNAQLPTPKSQVNPVRVRVGMTDWNLGQRGDITKITLAREIGLDGIQVSVQYPTDGKSPTLRDPKTQADFKRAALDNGIQICSLAIGPTSPGSRSGHTPTALSPVGARLKDARCLFSARTSPSSAVRSARCSPRRSTR